MGFINPLITGGHHPVLYVYHLTNPEILSALWSWNGSPCNPMPFISFFFFSKYGHKWVVNIIPKWQVYGMGGFTTLKKLCRTPPVPSSLRPFPSPATWRTEYLANPQKWTRRYHMFVYHHISSSWGIHKLWRLWGWWFSAEQIRRIAQLTQLPPPQTWHCQWQVHCQLQAHCHVDKPHCPEAKLSNRWPQQEPAQMVSHLALVGPEVALKSYSFSQKSGMSLKSHGLEHTFSIWIYDTYKHE